MAQYFFDIEINTELVVDDEGIDLEDHIQTSDDLRVDMRIRYADGTPIFAAKLTLNSQWLTPVPPSQLRQTVPRKTEP